MLDLCFALFVIALVLSVFAGFGHGMWLLIAAVFRAFFGSSEGTERESESAMCAGCDRYLPGRDRRCAACGLDRDSPLAKELADLGATFRQLDRLRQSDALAPALWEQVHHLLWQRREQLRHPQSHPPITRPAAVEPRPIPAVSVVPMSRAVEIPLAAKPVADVVMPVEEILDAIPVSKAVVEPPVRVEMPPVPPPPPHRSLGEVLSSFMEDRNILWGELIGGLLIVGCSIALVISLWQTLEQVPYSPFLVLGGITAALIGAGLYTLHHWKLESTSRGLLTIGTLLVPLNFMVLAGLERGAEGNRLLEFGVPAISLGLFAFLLQRAGRVLLPGQAWLLPLAVLGAAGGQLFVPWLLVKHQPVLGPILLLSAWPVLCQAMAATLMLRQVGRRNSIEASDLNALFGLLGMATFSTAAALGFLVYWNENFTFAFQRLAVAVATGGMAPLLCGAWTYRRLTDEPRMAAARATGTAIALGGAFLMLSAAALAWPRPSALIAVCGLNFTVLTFVAFRYRLPVTHAAALPCLALGYLTIWHELAGSPELSLLSAIFSPPGGTALAGLVVMLGIAASWLTRQGQTQSSGYYALGGGIAALASLVLVTLGGPADPVHPLAIYMLYGLGSLALNFRLRRPAVNYLGLGLLIAATLWGLQWRVPEQPAIWGDILAVEALLLAVGAVYGELRSSSEKGSVRSWLPVLGRACRDTAVAATVLAVALAVSATAFPGPAIQAYTAALLAATLLFLAWSFRDEWLTWAGSLFLFGSLFHAFAWNVADRTLPASLALALLIHAALALFASLALEAARVLRPFPTPPEISDRVYRLLTLPLRQTVLVNAACLLLPALASLIGDFSLPMGEASGAIYPSSLPWAVAAGGWVGWLDMLLALAAVGLLQRDRKQETTATVAAIGLVLVACLALSLTRWHSPMAGYRMLMLGWSGLALAVVLLGALRARAANEELSAAAAGWTCLAAVLAELLGVKAAGWHHDYLWAAGAIGLASAAGAVAAIGRRREDGAFAAGLGFNLAASFALLHFFQDQPFKQWWVYLIQVNGAANGAAALLWLATRKRLYAKGELNLAGSPFLATQNLLGLLANLAVLGPAFLAIFIAPTALPRLVDNVGEAGGVLSLLLPMAAAFWYAARASLRQRFSLFCLYIMLFGVLAGCAINQYDTSREWWAYQAIAVSWTVLGMACLGLGVVAIAFQMAETDIASRDREGAEPTLPYSRGSSASRLMLLFDSLPHVQSWVETIGLLVVVLALREAYWRNYEACAAAAAVSVMAMGMALWGRRQRHVYQFGMLIDLAAVFLWMKLGPHTAAGLLAVNALGLGLASAFWSLLETALEINAGLPRLRGRGVPFDHLATIASTVVLAFLVALGIESDLTGSGVEASGVLPWLALAAVAFAVLATLWDRTVSWTGAGLYALGLLAISLAFSGQNLSPHRFGWLLALALVGYVGLTSVLAYALPRLAFVGRWLQIPSAPGRRDAAWLAPAQVMVSGVAVLLSVWIAMSFPTLGQRLAGPLAAAALLPAGMLLAARFTAGRAAGFRQATLALFALVLAECGWALLGPEQVEARLHRTVVLMTALAATTLICGGALSRLSSVWADAARRLGPLLGAAAAILLLLVLVQEGLAYNPQARQAAVAPWAIAAVALGMLGLIVAGLRYALMKGDDPLGLSEKGRTLYVYSGEALLVLLLVHLRLTMPFLFTGLLAPYYTLILMVFAFLGVGLAEFFHRRGLRVLAEPLQRTGLFLPVLPLLAFWLQPDQTLSRELLTWQPLWELLSRLPRTYEHYARLWFLAAAIYGLAAFLRQSFRFALVAALTANCGLWALFAHQGWHFLAHPQLWLIPLAVLLLIAEHLNRDRLAPSEALGLRYLALSLLYLSATAEMFLTGLGKAWWVPLPLMLLAVAGMLLGILLRVRAYLFLGAGFLFLVVFSMIWNAAVNQQHTWIWWASGIVLGGAILALFAVFEKRRNDVLRAIERLKGWS